MRHEGLWLFFMLWQTILWVILAIHDWLPLGRLNDVTALRKQQSLFATLCATVINLGACTWALWLTLPVGKLGVSLPLDVVLIYLFMTVGTLLAWWKPYFFGSSAEMKQKMQPYVNTHHVLPARGDNIRPNTLHLIVHIFIWVAFMLSLIFTFT